MALLNDCKTNIPKTKSVKNFLESLINIFIMRR